MLNRRQFLAAGLGVVAAKGARAPGTTTPKDMIVQESGL